MMQSIRSLCRTAFRLVAGAVLLAVAGFAAVAADSSSERVMPPGYTQLDWVRSNGRQIVRTGISVASETVVEMSFGNVCYSRTTALFGQNWEDNCFRFTLENNGANRFMMYSGGTMVVAYDSTPADVDFTVKAGNGKVTVTNVGGGDSKTMDLPAPAAAATSEISVFGTSDGSHGGTFTFYSMTIAGANGALLRDFVPCRNPEGEVGLWDFASQTFFPNTGTERLFTPDETDVRLTRITAAKGAYIDTDYKPNQDTRTRMCLTVGGRTETWFGCAGNGSSGSDWWKTLSYALANDNTGIYIGYHGSSGTKSDLAILPVGWFGSVELNKNVVKIYKDNAAEPTVSYTVGAQTFDALNSIWLFGNNEKEQPGFQFKADNNVTCYGCKIWSGDGTPIRDFVPARRADGAIGMIDAQNNDKFYENKGFASEYTYRMTWDGIAYALNGTTLDVHEGVLASGDVTGYATVRKVDWYKLDATAVTSYPGALTLAKGLFSLKDGVAQPYTVTGALTLDASAKLEIDVTGDGCDTITAQSVVLSATAANPVDVRVNAVGVSKLDPTAKLEVFPNATFAAGDAEKFTASGMPVKFVVEDGRLYLEAKDAGVAEWTGKAGDGKWSTAQNWLDGEVPADGMTVKFDLTSGGATTFDLASGRTFKSIVFGENAGAFTIAGSATIGVTDAIRNESRASQSISAPCTFGVTGLTFEFACAGDLTFVSAVSEVPAEMLLKTGEGQLAIADTTLWKAANMTVRKGLLTTTRSGLVTSATPNAGGALVIEDGGMLDVNRDLGNSTANLAGVEAFHGKTIYIAGDGDGRGALYNSYQANNWGAVFGKVVLTGDASVGGETLTIRQMPSSRFTGLGEIEGPYTLTVKTKLSNPAYQRSRSFAFFNTVFALDRVDVAGMMCIENNPSGTITNGVHILDGGLLTFYNATAVPADCVPVVAEAGSSTLACDHNSTTASDVTVLPESVLSVDVARSVTLTLNGVVTVDGFLAKTAAGGTALIGGTLAGNGTLNGGAIRFNGTNARWAMAADDTGFTSKVDVSGATDAAFLSALRAIDVTYTGTTCQTLEIGPAFGLTSEQAQNITLTVTDGDGRPVADCWLGVADDKLQLHVLDSSIVAKARWIGGADSALDDPANWECRDKNDKVLPGTLPIGETVVDIPDGSVFNCTNGAPFKCKQLNLPTYLSADCDLRGVSADLGGTVDMRGRKIYLSAAKGEVTFTDGEYVLLESLRAPKGAYIDTEFLPTPETRTVMDLIVGGAYENWFGESGGGTGDWYRQLAYAVGNNPDNLYVGFGNNSGNGGKDAHRPTGWRGKVELNKNVYSAYEPGSTEPCTTFSIDYSTFEAKNTMFLFAHHTDSSSNYVKKDNNITCFSCQIWDNGTPVRDYVPALRVSDGVVGMIDRVNGNAFRGSASATAFVAGRPLEVQNGGEVHFDIPEGKTETNASVSFKGTVKVVKEGAGTLVATKTGQSYAGGTEVAAGTFRLGNRGDQHVYGSDGSVVTVREGATFDCDGYSDHNLYRFVLDGGTVKSAADRGNGARNSFADVTLTKDSFMAGYGLGFVANFGPNHLQMNGCCLTVDVTAGKSIFLADLTVEGAGEICARTGGFLSLGGSPNGDVRAETTTLRVVGAAISAKSGEIELGSIVNESKGGYDQAGAVFKVLDRFFLAGPGMTWHSAELQDGATLDLSSCTGAWDTTCEFTASKVKGSVTFAAGATIDVELGDRTIGVGEKVIGWTPETAPAKGVKFTSKLGKLRKMSDGAYYMQAFMIMIR